MKTRFFLSFFLFCAIASAQQTEIVDFIRIKAQLQFEEVGQVSGEITVEFEILKDVDAVFLDGVDMTVLQMQLTSGEDAAKDAIVTSENNKITITHPFKKNNHYSWRFNYTAKPKKALYFIEDQIWSQGQGKYTSNWLPSIDDMNDKIEFDLSVIYKEGYEVLSNGILVTKEKKGTDKVLWKYDMSAPMSSYLVALAIGKYSRKTETASSGIPLEYYFYPQDSLKFEPTYRYSKKLFDFLEQEIGFPYPWLIYRQVPVKDFLYSGMENTTQTLFSDALMVDDIAFKDRNYVNVNAHELAHQWFGDLVTETSSRHHWLQEGFATYYALLAERDVFGADYYYWQLYEYAQQLLAQENAGEGTTLLDPKASSVTFYQKGCWALHILREQVGDLAFKSAVQRYLQEFQYRNVETDDFLTHVERESGVDLKVFREIWLESVELPQDDMVKSLKRSEFVTEYLDVSCQTYPSKCQDYLVSNISDKAKVKIVLDPNYKVKLEDFNNALEVRQAIAQKLSEIPLDLKEAYESLLKDASYTTIETALYHLWVNFPLERTKYLQQTKDIDGFSDYNVKLLWLALNLNTLEYQPEHKKEIFEQLRHYTDAAYGFEVRMNAFNYLKLINGFDKIALKNLMDASHHHNWRFQQYAKKLLSALEEDTTYKKILSELKNEKNTDTEI